MVICFSQITFANYKTRNSSLLYYLLFNFLTCILCILKLLGKSTEQKVNVSVERNYYPAQVKHVSKMFFFIITMTTLQFLFLKLKLTAFFFFPEFLDVSLTDDLYQTFICLISCALGLSFSSGGKGGQINDNETSNSRLPLTHYFSYLISEYQPANLAVRHV